VAKFGVDCIEHGGSMTDETIQTLIDKKLPIVTTFSALVIQADPKIARAFDIPQWKIEERQRAVADKSRFDGLVRAAKAGVPIVFGTDAGSPAVEHDRIVPELGFMVEVGVCPNNLDALRAITARAALLNGFGDTLGTLEVGKLADMIVVDGKPDIDLTALEKVEMTFIDGKRMH
jgi:imidazolonepropionase-like amidohydrolase